MKSKPKWQEKHGETIKTFLKHLNKQSDNYILKGGTALMTCYNLDRFSEDIDLDGRGNTIEKIVNDYCTTMKFEYRVAKDTEVVKRYMINYGAEGRPLKVEISFRKKNIEEKEITKINSINVYKIDTLCIMKANAYNARDRIRDLYDLSYIYNNYENQLSDPIKSQVKDAVSYKGIEQFDYLMREQADELIDSNKLAENFLKMYEKLGLLLNEREINLLNNIEQEEREDDEEYER